MLKRGDLLAHIDSRENGRDYCALVLDISESNLLLYFLGPKTKFSYFLHTDGGYWRDFFETAYEKLT